MNTIIITSEHFTILIKFYLPPTEARKSILPITHRDVRESRSNGLPKIMYEVHLIKVCLYIIFIP